jgi:hypothetical protein
VVLALAVPANVRADDTHLGAHLIPTDVEPHATGTVQFADVFDSHHDEFLSLVVKVAHITSTDEVFVLVNGHVLDVIELDHTGAGHLSLATAHGDDVPSLNEGDVIDIVDAHGTILLEGTLHAF